MQNVDLSLWVSPLFDLKMVKVHEVEIDLLNDTKWYTCRSAELERLAKENNAPDDYTASLDQQLGEVVVEQVECAPEEISLESAILQIDTMSKLVTQNGEMGLKHFACFHYQEDGTLTILMCHTLAEEGDTFIGERQMSTSLQS